LPVLPKRKPWSVPCYCYLRDPAKFRKALIKSVASSTAIETGSPVASVARMLEESAKSAPLTPTRGSAR
jgi:hypothetical protein